MKNNMQLIFLLGFKHVGKTVIGKALAQQLGEGFIDLDREIESAYQENYQVSRSCREIMQTHGAEKFRALESEALKSIVDQAAAKVIALGGGAPMQEKNQALMASHILIHIQAPADMVYDRIMKKGAPAFFPESEDPRDFFSRLWAERDTIYQKLATFSIQNTGSIADAVEQILKKL